MPKLYDKDTGKLVGEITAEQLEFLNECLVEETDADRDYYMDGPVIEFLEEEGGDAALVAMLRAALGGREEMDVRWEP
ncbi:MAG: galactosyldiacylglycerol synthase [Acidobacteria bacterium]|jgi:processive 1,2-diacylglycerol beta-glucosyltransferase|nr:galactosyldiacylglycerol synthase [Acidobacteriota bacterium]